MTLSRKSMRRFDSHNPPVSRASLGTQASLSFRQLSAPPIPVATLPRAGSGAFVEGGG